MRIKNKTEWFGACERKKSALFLTFILSEGNFLNICILSQCIVYWINFQNINIYIYIYIPFQYQKKLLHALCLLVFKIVESPQCILRVLCLYIFDDFVERKYWILTFKVGYTFLQDTLYITTEKIISAWSINLISSPPYDQTYSRPHLWITAFGNTWENWHKLGWK